MSAQPNRRRSLRPVGRYLLAGAAVALAAVVRLLMTPLLESTEPYLTFYPAIIMVARYAGLGPGIVASLLSGGLATYFFLEPYGSLRLAHTADRVSMPLLVGFGLIISWFLESLRRAEQRQRELAALATDRARAEHAASERLASTHDELLHERRRVTDVVSDVPGVVWQGWGDPEAPGGQRLDFVSGYAYRWLGYRVQEWLATPNFWLAIVHPDDRDRTIREVHELYGAGFGGVIEFRWIGRDGRVAWVESHVRTIVEGGAAIGMRGVALDVTARKELEIERADLLAQAQASNRAKDEFLATVSHELRTPINAVLGWTQMLRAGILPPPRAARALEAIERNATMQGQMIEDLLDVSRIVEGKFRLDVQDVDLAQLARLAVDVVRPAADAKGVAVEAVLDDRRLPHRADPHRLQQAIWNLVSNAVKFTPAGGRVRVEIVESDDDFVIVVSDTGEGIAADVLPHIFERFRQGDASTTRPHAGLGIGLALVRHIAELHGGSVFGHSAGRGQGAVFRVRLPRRSAPKTSQPGRASAEARQHTPHIA